jgi:pyrimidine operon attenuation protein/uracil phosphoribosyltransferase
MSEITDEMVAAALQPLAMAAGGCPSIGAAADNHCIACDDAQCACRDAIRAALEAVAPMIRAKALEEAAVLLDQQAEQLAQIFPDERGGGSARLVQAGAAAIRAMGERG